MYCKNCGNTINENAAICVQCGCAVGTGSNYCPTCGQPTAPGAAVCTNCGVALTAEAPAAPGAKSKMTAGLLGIFLGAFGVHNFYLGFTGKAVAQLLITLLSCFFLSPVFGISGLIEGIMLLCGKVTTDGKGNTLA